MRRIELNPWEVNKWKAAAVDVAAGGDATVTLDADATQHHVIDSIHYSYAGAPTGGGITIVHGSVTRKLAITEAGQDVVYFPRGYDAPALGEAVTITLLDGGVVKNLLVQYR